MFSGSLPVLLACGLLAACDKEDMTHTEGTPLPEGKYPLVLTASGLEISATTRATADGTWDQGDGVAIQIGSDVKKYTADGNDASTTLSAADNVTPFYWQNTSETKSVSAWYLGTEYNATLPETWSVQEDQNTNSGGVTGYQRSDFLYAPQTNITFNNRNNAGLTFYHQTAKVVVNIRNYGVATDASKISSVSINAITEGTFNVNASGNYRLSATAGKSTVSITPKSDTPNTGEVFENGQSGEKALASYQALVIPQTLSSSNQSIQIQIDGYDTFTYTIPTGSWAGGTQYTYNLTIEGSEVTATVTTGSITWGEGDSGSGSVEI